MWNLVGAQEVGSLNNKLEEAQERGARYI